MENANKTSVTFLEPINTHNGPEDNDQIGCNQDSQNNLPLFGVVEEDFAMCKAINGDAGHSEAHDKNDKGTEARDSFQTGEHYLLFR